MSNERPPNESRSYRGQEAARADPAARRTTWPPIRPLDHRTRAAPPPWHPRTPSNTEFGLRRGSAQKLAVEAATCGNVKAEPDRIEILCTWTRHPFGLTLYGNLLQIIFLQRILSFNIKLYVTQLIY